MQILNIHMKRYIVIVTIILFSNQSIAINIVPHAPKINAKAFILIDFYSGKVLAERNADQRLTPASLTKIMSSYVIGQAIQNGIINLNDIVTIEKDFCHFHNTLLHGSSLMFLKPGEQVTVENLNKGIIIPSGNDASIALATYISGTQQEFVNLMNQYVISLGLKNTHFLTVHGLDAIGQYSSARDMAVLSRALIHNVPNEYILHEEKEFTHNNIKQFNRNRLLWSKTLKVDGIKTGYTSGAGYNLAASATNNNMRLISIVLGSPTDILRFKDSEQLLSWGLRFYETIRPIMYKWHSTKHRVWFGKLNTVNLTIANGTAITLPKGQFEHVKISYSISTPYLKAPLNKGQIVGTANFSLNETIIEQLPLVVEEDIQQCNFVYAFWDWIVLNIQKFFDKIKFFY